jgi:anti-sigma B factor antagonist
VAPNSPTSTPRPRRTPGQGYEVTANVAMSLEQPVDEPSPDNEPSPDDAPGESVAVDVEHRGDGVVLHASGELDLLTTPALTDAITTALRDQPAVLVINLADVGFIASRGLEALVLAHNSSGGTSVRVVASSRATTRAIEVTGLDTILHVYNSVTAALEAIEADGPTPDASGKDA